MPGARLLRSSDKEAVTHEHLAGRVSQHTSLHPSARYPNLSRGHVEWLVAAPSGVVLTITIESERAGVCRATVTVGD